VSDGEKLTYVLLKSFAYVGPETFVGEETLARARGLTVSTVSRHLQRLIEVGLVKVRRRGQGKTNIWIIARIPREKLVTYLQEWRPNIRLPRNPQTKTTQNPQIKTERNPQAEEEEREEPSGTKRKHGGQPRSGGSGSLTADRYEGPTERQTSALEARERASAGDVDNYSVELSTVSTNVENLAEFAAEAFGVRGQERSITGFLAEYDLAVARDALGTVVHRLERGDRIENPVAYFYAVVKMMQAQRNAEEQEQSQTKQEKRAIAVSWARSLLREWPMDQARAILIDTYGDSGFADEILREVGE